MVVKGGRSWHREKAATIFYDSHDLCHLVLDEITNGHRGAHNNHFTRIIAL